MRGGEAFEEVLDQHIQRLEADRRVTEDRRPKRKKAWEKGPC